MAIRRKVAKRPAAKSSKKVGSTRVVRTGRTVAVGGVKRSFKTAAAAKGAYTRLRGKTALGAFKAKKTGVKRPAAKRPAAKRPARKNPSRAQIGKMTRRELQAFLESHGYAVYANEKIADLRETARSHAGGGYGPMALHPAFVPGRGFTGRNPGTAKARRARRAGLIQSLRLNRGKRRPTGRRRNPPVSPQQANALRAILRRHGYQA